MRGWTALTIRIPDALEDAILLTLSEGETLGVHLREEGEEPAESREPDRGAPVRARWAQRSAGERGHTGADGTPRGRPSHRTVASAAGRVPNRERHTSRSALGARRTLAAAPRTGVAYFKTKAAAEGVRRRLAALDDSLVLGVSEVEDGAWVERQDAARRPLRIGRRFLIRPRPAQGREAPAGRITLVVPPKRAFGTGEHETTRQCLEILERIPLRGRDVLDLGTGSGILAMAAARLGARRVLAADDDPEAIGIARENLRLNGLGRGRVRLLSGSHSVVTGRFSLILANLYGGLLETLAQPLARLQSAGGEIVLSGFSPREASRLARAFVASGYRERHRSRRGEWSALLLEKVAIQEGSDSRARSPRGTARRRTGGAGV